MNNVLFGKIKNSHYANFISFAVWNDNDINDLSAIEKNIKKLNHSVIIVGLNASGSIKKFQNFHFIHRGGRDSWLKDAFNHSCFHGAYMTDIIKNDISSRQLLVDLSEDNIIKNVKEFEKELNFIKCKNPYIIAIGVKTTEIFKKYLPEYTKNLHSILHYAGRGITKNDFIKSVKKLENKFINSPRLKIMET